MYAFTLLKLLGYVTAHYRQGLNIFNHDTSATNYSPITYMTTTRQYQNIGWNPSIIIYGYTIMLRLPLRCVNIMRSCYHLSPLYNDMRPNRAQWILPAGGIILCIL